MDLAPQALQQCVVDGDKDRGVWPVSRVAISSAIRSPSSSTCQRAWLKKRCARA